MKQIHSQTLLALCIHGLLMVILSLFPTSRMITWGLLPFFILNCIGLILILNNKPKTGGTLFLWSSIPFLPIGLIGTLGARKVIDTTLRTSFLKIVYKSEK